MHEVYRHVTENQNDNEILYFNIGTYIESALRKLERENPDCFIKLVGAERVE